MPRDNTPHYCYECDREHPGPYLDREDVWRLPEGWPPPTVLGDCNRERDTVS